MAARIAEQRHTAAQDIWRDQNDRVRATNLALANAGGDIERAGELINRMLVETRARVEQHWAEIERLAHALLLAKRVTFTTDVSDGGKA
jgi:hypothetical protein